MKFGAVPIHEATGHILAHNLVDEKGHKRLNKGRIIAESDLESLQSLGLETVIVAQLEPTDLHENEAARRVGEAVAGSGIRIETPGVGRANLIATEAGPLCINVPALTQLNNIDAGITIATLHQHRLVKPGELVTLVKIIPFGVAAARVEDVEARANENKPVLWVRPLRSCSVALILTGPDSARERLLKAFTDPVRERIEALNSHLNQVEYVNHHPEAVAAALQPISQQHDLVIVAGISAIIDMADVVPTALQLAGGTVTHFGVPVDPGTLLMLGYIGSTPVMGAPGCIKSRKTNVIDWLLPRLIAGERLTRADIVALGHGGLLDDISDRPMPRSFQSDD